MKESIYIIGEVAQAHEGSVRLAHSYIDALAECGVDAVKFQMHMADAESSQFEGFRTNIPFTDCSRQEYWREMEFTKSQWAELKAHCSSVGVDFIVSPFSIAAVDLLMDLNVSKFKIASGEVGNVLMLDKIAATGRDVILSSGMSTFADLDRAMSLLKTAHCGVSLLQCTTSYPTSLTQWGLNMLDEFKQRYQVPIGLSDHSGDITACLAAAALGTELLEFHAIFDKRIQNPDAHSSLTIYQATQMIRGVRQIETALAFPVNKNDNSGFTTVKTIFGKSLACNKHLEKGQPLTINDLETKKPAGYGIAPSHYREVLGKTLVKDIAQWEFLTENHIAHA
ncbi:N-acetylneuraminate synthase family protein [Dyadobacter sp. MSC1_007]|jgi:N,N'-diacetyllegionaminate synthase|uniref:N-acetylneuraminate synthase family protein n=1 Tax=Dyadobacter sp. MSC1_007 TaxID=2909264 RepID=UPI002030FB4A|nr:N-acetylneuraminate synthase family protein [Dyadobacter sp. MSC1_007]